METSFHKDQKLEGLSSEGLESAESLDKPDSSKQHHISGAHLSRRSKETKLIQDRFNKYFSTKRFEVFQNTIKMEEPNFYVTPNVHMDAQAYLVSLVKQDRLHKWKSLKQINLQLSNTYIDPFLLPIADFIISRMPDIQGISLDCRYNLYTSSHNIKGTVIQAFVENITKHMKNLRKFELSISAIFDKFTDKNVKFIIRQILRNLSHLEVLRLHLHSCYHLNRECLEALRYHTRRHLPKLKELDLSFERLSGIKFEENPNYKFKFDIFFPNLRSLNLNLNDYLDVSSQELVDFISNTLAKLQFLQDLTLKLCRSLENLDQELPILSSSIGQISTLKKLNLSLESCKQISEKGFRCIIQEICCKNVNLRELILVFQDCDGITDSGIIFFANEIGAHLKNLEKLSFIVFEELGKEEKGDKLTDGSLEAISKALTESLTNLTYLDLDLCGCRKITEKGVGCLTQGVQRAGKEEIWL